MEHAHPVPLPSAPGSRSHIRHHLIQLSFFLCVLLPCVASFSYMYFVATDQYSSVAAFTVRSEELQNPFDAIETLGQISADRSSDTDILYDFLYSQRLVDRIDARLDIDRRFSFPEFDPVFAYESGQPVEDLTDYWAHMVDVDYDRGAGLIRLEVYGFSPQDAHDIATAIVEESDILINELSQISRADATRFAEETKTRAETRLKDLRLRLLELRNQNQSVDPVLDLEIRMGVISALQEQLANVLVQQDMLFETTRSGDPRLSQYARQIEALNARITVERDALTNDTSRQNEGLIRSIGAYESLRVDLEFAQQAYLAASATHDTAMAEARRRSRYLATHIPPTYPESALYPRRFLIAAAVSGLCLMVWLASILMFYAARDRR